MTQHYDTDVLIIGGGLVGGMTACALARGGVDVVVVDADDPETLLKAEYDGRCSAIARSVYNAFVSLGLWDHMEPEAGIIEDIRVTDGTSPLFLHFDSLDLTGVPFGYMLENRTVRKAILKVVPDMDHATYLAPKRVEKLERSASEVNAKLNDGIEIKAKLVIGADGRGSWVRRSANIDITKWSYDQTAIVCTVQSEKPHLNVAQEHFLPNGPFAILPMQGTRSSIVWTESTRNAPMMMKLSDEDFQAELSERFGDYLGEVKVEGPRWSYPLTLQFAKRSIDTRLALVGDASHGMHPVAGQGFNMGARDACAIAELIIETKKLGLDVGAGRVLEDYDRWRHFDNHLMLASTDAIVKLFSNNSTPLRLARDIGLTVVDQIPFAKKFFTKSAMGLVGELPEIMKEREAS
ncbi:UbiH/UbiF/VisC/COQ6 family ubiquinone biosynthesis hydroxylase [Terasakiella sp. SH-1]|uniref:UbiH/UbiF/VisC/COQ6 family ubiquinone biosynthesis hydroxylase n=1 Tax=Terasakiella sp. SH-1 TaxID=2560057 RepID=UPI0010737E67|nr:UbiH/UbiF/VisC/COQ6 family ubiquinone biosynthesis hydroxylase [Terasakiella sp. SH-1]